MASSLEVLQGAWRASFGEWRRKFDDSPALSPEDKSTCHALLKLIEQSPLSKAGGVTDLFDALAAKPEKKSQHTSACKFEMELQAKEVDLQKAEDINQRWGSG